MKKISEFWSKDSKAFQMFLEELRQLVSNIEKLLSEIGEDNEGLQETLRQGFHRTKGAAGMFGLDELADISSKLEETLSAPLVETFQNNFETKALLEQFRFYCTELTADDKNGDS